MIPTKALSVRAPWWWAILHGKPIENRDWPTKFRGLVFLHSSSWWKQEEVEQDLEDVFWMAEQSGIALPEPDIEKMRSLGGHLVGTMDVFDCVSKSESPWFMGKYGFLLRDQTELVRPVPYRGELGFFNIHTGGLKACS